MTAPARTLTAADFVLARLAEDEAAARHATAGPWRYDPLKMNAIDHEGSVFAGPEGAMAICVASTGPESGQSMIDARHIATHDPARVLAQCEALRAVVAAHPIVSGPRLQAVDSTSTDFGCETCHCIDPIHDGGIIEALGWCDTVRALASIWRDHPAFDPSWAAS